MIERNDKSRESAGVRGLVGWRYFIGDVGLIGVMVIAVVRCLVSFSSVPVWWLDIVPRDDIQTGFGAVGTAMVDWLCVCVLVLALVDRVVRGRKVHWVLVGLWGIGVGFVIYHGSGYATSARIGGNWVGAISLGLAAMHLADVGRRKRLIVMGMVALALPLGLDGVNQVTFEHAMNITHYNEHKSEVLSQHGIELGSIGQRKFEERLTQREATGKFGLSNVFGSVLMMVMLVGGGVLVGVLVGVSQSRARWVVGAGVLGVVVVGGVGLAMTFSKGAALALCASILAVVVGVGVWRVLVSGVWLWRAIGFGVVAMGIGVVVVRGMMGVPDPGTPGGERSLLYRSMYWQGAVAMVLDYPIAGVGPGCFQENYVTRKNPLCPEDVADPHNIFVSFVSMLGVGGLAWSVVLCAWLWRACGAVGRCDESDECEWKASAELRRWYWRMAGVIGVIAFGIQYWMHFAMLVPLTAMILAAGFAVFVLFIGVVPTFDINDRCVRTGLFGAAVGVLLHSQIEMSMVNVMAGLMLCVLLGTAGAVRDSDDEGKRKAESRWWGVGCVGVGVLVLSCFAWLNYARVYEPCESFDRAKTAFRKGDIKSCLEWLKEAQRGDSTVVSTRVRAIMGSTDNGYRGEMIERSLASLELARETGHNMAKLWRLEVRVCDRAWMSSRDEKWVDRGIDAAVRMLAYGPYSISGHMLAGDFAWRAGRRELAGRWYARALALDEFAYLDPNARMSAGQRELALERS